MSTPSGGGARAGGRRAWRGERGLTLPEALVVIAIMGIVLAIASSTWFGVVESRRVDAATNQVASDLRLIQAAATNRLGTARLIFRNNGEEVNCNGVRASYCLTRPGTDGSTQSTPRYLPPDNGPPADRVKLTSPNLLADVLGGTLPPGVVPGTTSTVEFRADGSASALGPLGVVNGVPNDCPAGTPAGVPRLRVVSADGDPRRCITVNSQTSRVRID